MNPNAKRRVRSGPALAILLLLGLGVGYPLSTGPAALLCNLAGEPPFLATVLGAFYKPLGALPKPMLDRLGEWIDFWDGLVP